LLDGWPPAMIPMQKIAPFLSFDAQAKEAFAFYLSVSRTGRF
jgi:predicted 3-demethylubiquinone-9 3-methyltransferase (glyoxalase superfamily)